MHLFVVHWHPVADKSMNESLYFLFPMLYAFRILSFVYFSYKLIFHRSLFLNVFPGRKKGRKQKVEFHSEFAND